MKAYQPNTFPLPGYLNLDTKFLEVTVMILDCGSDDRILDPVREVKDVFFPIPCFKL